MARQRIKLGEVAEIISGSTPSRAVPEYWGGEIAWITPKELSNLPSRYIDRTRETISDLGLNSCSAKILPVNSVLFSSRAPIGHVAITKIPLATNQGFKSFIPNQAKLDSDYLYYYLNYRKETLQAMGRGATFKELSKELVQNIEIPLPALAEQRRIAAILDKVDELRAKRQQTLRLLDDLAQSVFFKMFGDLAGNDKKWHAMGLGEVVEFLDNERIPVKHSERVPGPYPYYGANGQQGTIDGYIFDEPLILLAEDGGHFGSKSRKIAYAIKGKSWVNNHAHVLRPKPMVNLRYLLAVLEKYDVTRFVTGSTRGKLTKSAASKIPIIMPPIEKQNYFSNYMESFDSLRAKFLASAGHLDDLMQSLLASHF
ncbi:MAG: restriction endonuclease subunit S [Anaerolineales bacterium]|nr:restriction endonuclease subunit S [Anaerolineales bacterium]